MTRAFNQSRISHTAVPGILMVLTMILAMTVAPSAQAKTRSDAAVTVTSITYRLDSQLLGGPHAGTAVHGWVSGSLDSTGLFTATLISGQLAPIVPGCAPHVEFGPACGYPISANVNGNIVGSAAALTAKGKGWTWVLGGGHSSVAGSWAGALTQGSAVMGSWSLTPATTTIHIDLAIKSDAKSKDKIVLVGAIDLNVTSDGWAIGTFSPVDGTLPTIVEGYANPNKASVEVSIPMGKQGTILFTSWSRPGFGNNHWNGTFVGPATGDYGTIVGQG